MPLSTDPRVNAQRIILRKLIAGPLYARSFQTVKGPLAGLVQDGFVRRIAPPNGRAKNMVILTDAGRAEAHRRKE